MLSDSITPALRNISWVQIWNVKTKPDFQGRYCQHWRAVDRHVSGRSRDPNRDPLGGLMKSLFIKVKPDHLSF